MDNLTHTLIGATAAKAFPKKFQKPSVYWAMVIGNNLPDSDFIYSLLPTTTGLDYLVHHRGYTHSVFFSLALAPIGGFIAAKLSRSAFNREVCLFTLLGCWMHMWADWLNNYGVHPFSPFLNQWFYGDSVFIVEPLIWAVLIPCLIFMAARKSAKLFWMGVGAVALGVVWTTGYLDLNLKIFVTLLSLGSAVYHRWTKQARAAFVSFILIVGLFRTSSLMAKNKFSSGHLPKIALDISTTPNPGNPFCWTAWILSENESHFESIKKGLSLWPAIYTNEECSRLSISPESSVPLLLSKQEFHTLYESSCKFQRLMSFVRFPFMKKDDGNRYLAGDLRYAHPGRGNFTQTLIDDVQKNPVCPLHSVPWDSPFLHSIKRNPG